MNTNLINIKDVAGFYKMVSFTNDEAIEFNQEWVENEMLPTLERIEVTATQKEIASKLTFDMSEESMLDIIRLIQNTILDKMEDEMMDERSKFFQVTQDEVSSMISKYSTADKIDASSLAGFINRTPAHILEMLYIWVWEHGVQNSYIDWRKYPQLGLFNVSYGVFLDSPGAAICVREDRRTSKKIVAEIRTDEYMDTLLSIIYNVCRGKVAEELED